MRTPPINALLITLSFALTTSAYMTNAAITFQSNAEQTSLIELYTSEGCSSCPPAESWLSQFKRSPGLWKQVVPLVFHVDYWDDLGWRDRWASKSNTRRQQKYADDWGNDGVYTPGFVLNGREWQNWTRYKDVPATARTQSGVLTVATLDTNRWTATFKPANGSPQNFEIHAALLGCGLRSKVKSGENRGRNLTHNFVVLTLVDGSMTEHASVARGEFILKSQSGEAAQELAVAVWVTRSDQLEPLQATGGWLTESDARSE